MKFCQQCQSGFPEQTETCPTHGGSLSEIIELRPGMLVRGTYKILQKLGVGGFGTVYLAEQILMEELRAVKFLSLEWSQDEDFSARFRREVRTLRQVRHRNVVDCGDLERAEFEGLFFSMEYVDGPDLKAHVKKATQPMDVQTALDLARGVSEGLGAAHAKGMVHRDIKPENILLARGERGEWVPKIADFGIVATKEASSYTRTGQSLLTVAYAAPEQWRGEAAAELDGRTDLYALGGVLFYMLTGRTAFRGGSYEEWCMQHLNAVPPFPSSLRADLAYWRGLDALVMRLLAKDRGDRPRDVREVVALLDGIRYSVADPPPAPAAGPPRGAQAPTRPQQPEPARPQARNRRKGLWIFGSVTALFLLATFVILVADSAGWFREGARPRQSPDVSAYSSSVLPIKETAASASPKPSTLPVAAPDSPIEPLPSVDPGPVVAQRPEQEEPWIDQRSRADVWRAVQGWGDAIRAGDIDAYRTFYAAQLNRYYARGRVASQDVVERMRGAFQQYQEKQIDLSNPAFLRLGPDDIQVDYDKEYKFSGAGVRLNQGKVRQSLQFTLNAYSEWKITGEFDQKVCWSTLMRDFMLQSPPGACR